jgi:hypothetical protein
VNVSPVLPWELNAALEQERLVTLAKVAVETRNRAFAEADRAAGDTNWGLACKAHERLMFALSRMAESGEHPWLTVIRDGLYLMPLIGTVPIRLFRGSPERVSSRHLDAVRLEAERVTVPDAQIAFSFMVPVADDGPWYWLMAMETDEHGLVTRVVYFQANDAGQTRHAWECRLPQREAEPVPPPVVELAPVAQAEAKPAQPTLVDMGPAAEQAPRRRGGGGKRAARTAPAIDTRQETFWSTALGAE